MAGVTAALTTDRLDDNPGAGVHDRTMLHHLPRPLHRLVLRHAHGLRLWWWRKAGRTVRGCNVIAANASGHVLLVRHSYHAPEVWMLPGGGLGRTESPIDAARRELVEEVGCVLGAPRHLDTFTLDRSGWTNVIEVVTGTTTDEARPDGREIAAAQFFDPHDLPHPTGGHLTVMIARWLDVQNGSSA